MKYDLKAYSIWEQGRFRSNQEDNIFPELGKVTDNDRMFILCDGMGGHDNGEVASLAVCQTMSQYIQTHASGDSFSDEVLKEAVNAALDRLDMLDNGSASKMGTTMTFLQLHAQGATVAHIGDSRVYHIRPGKNGTEDTQILFVTEDHSLVNSLVKLGEMTPEEAKTSKQKNVITRAMMPNQERRVVADIAHLTDVREGDYFFMCSDGMLDQMDDDNLRFIFSKPGATDEEKVQMLKGSSLDSHDNHSAHIIHIVKVEGRVSPDEPSMSAIVDDEAADAQQRGKDTSTSSIFAARHSINIEEKKKNLLRVAVVLVFAAIVAFALFKLSGDKQDKVEDASVVSTQAPFTRSTNQKVTPRPIRVHQSPPTPSAENSGVENDSPEDLSIDGESQTDHHADSEPPAPQTDTSSQKKSDVSKEVKASQVLN
ncbi:MAG: protein phosphatase 2C domain-containing protein [Bacteroidales bacterium]|nr:protein phosphatase 2C domain-containing protein [Bacteroidales bacterium]